MIKEIFAVKGKTAELDMIYQEIYADGVLTYEIETFTDEGECEILYYRYFPILTKVTEVKINV